MFSHLNEQSLPKMVDISAKRMQLRKAQAQSRVEIDDEIKEHFVNSDIQSPKGAVFTTAIVAGIQAVKQTSQLIPLCHPIPLSSADIDITLRENFIHILCTVSSSYATGVEMEAIVGASIAAITVYDMCKSINSNIIIRETKLLYKKKEA